MTWFWAIFVLVGFLIFWLFGFFAGQYEQAEPDTSYLEYDGHVYEIVSNDHHRVTLRDPWKRLTNDVSGEDVKVVLRESLWASGFCRLSCGDKVCLSLWSNE